MQGTDCLGPKYGAPEWKKKDDLERKYSRFLSSRFSVLSFLGKRAIPREKAMVIEEEGGLPGNSGACGRTKYCRQRAVVCATGVESVLPRCVLRSHAVGFTFVCRHLPCQRGGPWADYPGENQPGRTCLNRQKREARAVGLPESQVPCLFHPAMVIAGTHRGATPTVELDMTNMNKKPLRFD